MRTLFIFGCVVISCFSPFTLAFAGVADDSDSLVMIQSLTNIGASVQGKDTESASLSVKNLQCRGTGCSFLDATTSKVIEYTQESGDDLVFDIAAAIYRVTGEEDKMLSSVDCTWNDSETGSGQYRCEYALGY